MIKRPTKTPKNAISIAPRPFVSEETLHVLYPDLPLDGLPKQGSLFDALAAQDLAESMGMIQRPSRSNDLADGEIDER